MSNKAWTIREWQRQQIETRTQITHLTQNKHHIDGLVQDCNNSIANAMELVQSCTKPSTYLVIDELWCIYCAYVGDNLLRYEGTSLYHDILNAYSIQWKDILATRHELCYWQHEKQLGGQMRVVQERINTYEALGEPYWTIPLNSLIFPIWYKY